MAFCSVVLIIFTRFKLNNWYYVNFTDTMDSGQIDQQLAQDLEVKLDYPESQVDCTIHYDERN